MSRPTLKMALAAGACAVTAFGAAGAASAANIKIYGGGASLPSPYMRQAADCYGNKVPLIFRDGTGGDNPTATVIDDFNYTGTPPFNCATDQVKAGQTLYYISTGSGRGISGVVSHDPARWGDIDPATAGIQLWPSVQYGLSETALGSADVAIYNGGGSIQSVTVVAPGETPGSGQYANPREKYGPLVQVPFLIAPVTIAHDPVYKKVRAAGGAVIEYTFNIRNLRADGSGGLRLDADTYCKIFNGQITNWNDPALKALNGGRSLKDPQDPTAEGAWSVPMQIVGRSDSSGTTSLWTRHLAAVCGGVAGNAYADSTSTLPAGLIGVTYDKTTANSSVSGTPGTYVIADGNDGVAKYIDFTQQPQAAAGSTRIQGRIGYLGPDYTLPAADSTGSNEYNLFTADLKNSSGKFVAPKPELALAAFGSITPPDSNPNGTYDPGSDDPRDRANPQDWVEPASKTSPLANPSAPSGYPIVGTSNFLAYTCYSTPAKAAATSGFLKWYVNAKAVNDKTLGVLAHSGFAPLPANWRKAINETFATNNSGLDLNIRVDGQGGVCNEAGVVGG